MLCVLCFVSLFFFQAEDGIRDAQESRGLGDVYKRQVLFGSSCVQTVNSMVAAKTAQISRIPTRNIPFNFIQTPPFGIDEMKQ